MSKSWKNSGLKPCPTVARTIYKSSPKKTNSWVFLAYSKPSSERKCFFHWFTWILFCLTGHFGGPYWGSGPVHGQSKPLKNCTKFNFTWILGLNFLQNTKKSQPKQLILEKLPVSVPILTLLLRNTPACVSVSPKLSSSLLQSRIEWGSARAQAESSARIVPYASAQYEGARARFFSATR